MLVWVPAVRTVEQAHQLVAGPGYRVRMDTTITPRACVRADRPNTDLSAAVDQALAVCLELGPRAAATFLEARGAAFALTCRVLGQPERRRARTLDLPPPLR